MFYWRNEQGEPTLSDELLCCTGVRQIKIATAYLSEYGATLLMQMAQKYQLKEEDIELFLSAEFSSNKPHEQLQKLRTFCQVHIITDKMFHPKVYWLTGRPDKLLFGSSNFTDGGFERNIEFDAISTPSDEETERLQHFFAYCRSVSLPVSDEMIAFYQKQQSAIEKLHTSQQNLRTLLHSFQHDTDAFEKDAYDLTDFYFTYADYETFFERNQRLDQPDIRVRRQAVQQKMLRIHRILYPEIQKLGIACHRRPENITSLIQPCVYNHGHVTWLGIRYGKTPKELDLLNAGAKKDEVLGFQKHGCLQYCIGSNGFEVNLFFAVRHDAVDRDWLHEHLKEQGPKIEAELTRLKGYGMQWVTHNEDIGNTENEVVFNIDDEPAERFLEFFKKHDKDGRESYLRMWYPPDDEYIKTVDTLTAEILEAMKLLLPLYNAMVWRIS